MAAHRSLGRELSQGETLPQGNLIHPIEKDRFASLEEILVQIESDYAEYLLMTEISGLWPPYSFSTDLEGFQNEVPAA